MSSQHDGSACTSMQAATAAVPAGDIALFYTHLHPDFDSQLTSKADWNINITSLSRQDGEGHRVHGSAIDALAGILNTFRWHPELVKQYGFGNEALLTDRVLKPRKVEAANGDSAGQSSSKPLNPVRVLAYRLACLRHLLNHACQIDKGRPSEASYSSDSDHDGPNEAIQRTKQGCQLLNERYIKALGGLRPVLKVDQHSRPHKGKYVSITLGDATASALGYNGRLPDPPIKRPAKRLARDKQPSRHIQDDSPTSTVPAPAPPGPKSPATPAPAVGQAAALPPPAAAVAGVAAADAANLSSPPEPPPPPPPPQRGIKSKQKPKRKQPHAAPLPLASETKRYDVVMHAHRLVAFARHGFMLTLPPDAQFIHSGHPCQALQALHNHLKCSQHGMCVRAEHIMLGNFLQNAVARKDSRLAKQTKLQAHARLVLTPARLCALQQPHAEQHASPSQHQQLQTPTPATRRNPYTPDPTCGPRSHTRTQRAQAGIPTHKALADCARAARLARATCQ